MEKTAVGEHITKRVTRKRRRKRKKRSPLINVNTSAIELPNALSVDNMHHHKAIRPPIMQPNFSRPSWSPHPDQALPFSDMPSRFSLNPVSRRWLSPIPFWHAKSVFPTSVPVAVVPPLPGVQVGISSANARSLPHPIPSTLSASDSVKSSGTQTFFEDIKLSAITSFEQNQSSSSQVSELAVDVASCEFKNRDAVNVSSATEPVIALSTTDQVLNPSVNDEGLNTALNAETPNDSDEIIYLYRVEPEQGKLIEVVDLSEDPNEISGNRNLVLSSRNQSSDKETEMTQGLNKSSLDNQEVLEIYSSISVLEKSKGPGLPTHANRKRKREEDLHTHCSVCHRNNEGVCKDGNLLFISKCGHIFCVTCLKNLVPYKCTECNAGISNLCKVVF